MDQMSKCRCKIWVVVIVFFVCWYLMVHNVKWYNFTSSTSMFRSQENPVEEFVEDSITSNHVVNEKKTYGKATNGGNDQEEGGIDEENTARSFVDGEIDWVRDVAQLRDLEKELEPVLKELKPKPEKKMNKTMIEKRKAEMRERRVKEAERKTKRLCSGRYIYVHDLPSRFNDEILDDCREFSKWQNMCPYIANNGLGPNLGNPERVFSRSGWYSTNQFLLEVIFRNRMKHYECLTNDSSIASAIYVPYYAGLDVWRYIFDHNISSSDALSVDLAKWLRKRPEWKVASGRDHFLVAGRIIWDFRREVDDDDAWGNKLMLLPELKNMTTLTIEKSPWHSNDFGIPYPTNFHPKTDSDINDWQIKMKRRRRRVLFSFAGAPRPEMEESIREEIIEQCIASTRKCKLLQCSNNNLKCYQPIDVMKLFQSSVFCLQPPGDSYTRRSTFDSILAGCIPVFFTPGSAYVQYLWHLPKQFEKYSILINEEDVKRKNVSIEKVLSRIPTRKVVEMRNEVIELIPNVVYADPKSKLEKFKDAFDISVKGVLEKIGNVTSNITSNVDLDERFSWKYYLFGSVEKNDWDHYFRYSMNQKVKQVEVDAN